ncbi:MAG: NAD-dependent epimerase/dehydratase family protein [Flavobacteriales bacterium]|nr:NAD-dependent epimerase/dehydratase family protein [Flavobacteriales bacterium]
MPETILIIGSEGQVGTDLAESLREVHGSSNVVCCDIRPHTRERAAHGPYAELNVLEREEIAEVFSKYKPTVIYHLAAMLSATAEMNPKTGWELNMDGLFNIFDAAIEYGTKRVFWPSSIAVFGPNTPREHTPQYCVMDPNTVYGISKLAGERYCEYYHKRWGLDVRSLRYPGLIGWKAQPGGGTTDYAVDIFHQALKNGKYTSFLSAGTYLPMMYMDDAVRATIQITDAPADQIRIRSSYNLSGFSFDPAELAAEIKKHLPHFEMDYKPDNRQAIADSWPSSIDDEAARSDWGWDPEYDLPKMVAEMLTRLSSK